MKTIVADSGFRKCLRFIIGLLMMSATGVAAYAQPLTKGLSAEELVVEAPTVQRILKRAAFMEQSSAQTSNQQYAARLYCIAARFGSLEAQYRLGKMILEGRGMKKSVETAATLFSIAAGNGDEDASSMLAVTGVQKESLPSCLINPESCIDADSQ